MNIFVAKLNFETNEDSLRAAFEEFGEVESVMIIHDKLTQRSKGFGFVEMANEDDGIVAIGKLNATEIDGRTIVVKKQNLDKVAEVVDLVTLVGLVRNTVTIVVIEEVMIAMVRKTQVLIGTKHLIFLK